MGNRGWERAGKEGCRSSMRKGKRGWEKGVGLGLKESEGGNGGGGKETCLGEGIRTKMALHWPHCTGRKEVMNDKS